MNTDKICIFTDQGKMHTIKVLDIPTKKLRDKGVPIDNLSNFSSQQERPLMIMSMEQVKASSLLFVTRQSMVKIVEGCEFDVTKRTIAATKLAEEDEVIFVGVSDYSEFVVLQSEKGYFLRFLVQEVPLKKKGAIGVRGMRLAEGDALIGAYLLESSKEYTAQYGEKQVNLNRLKLSKRDSKGTKQRS